ncbi:hypothetical protein HPO96_31455 [Kribbella sandramycini]|uniref:Uncharacterized protein n=1 Tax=Kribbella sandramycini TaxID=60450 RepID=A0A7Y4P1Y5_9ACTN|nr:hypothetical protein [Kribbella sandramycini]MBB6567058.1 hypothetical protein [Kribbella sandramycini]NOL44777.1 hypothetical protein [Kribbella sandramycini]
MRKIMALVASLAAMTMTLTGQAWAAQASGPSAHGNAVMAPAGAELSRDIYLSTGAPVGSTASWSRSIYLAAGNYRWQLDLTGLGSPLEREIYLAAGTYEWVVTVRRIFTHTDSKYVVESTLKQACCGPASLSTRLYTPVSGNYHIGSLLIPS